MVRYFKEIVILTEYIPCFDPFQCRKHLRNKRLLGVHQLGIDRVVDLEFGSGEACYHLIVEVYDRGNVILTDYQYTILHLLRARKDSEADVRFAIGETYPKDRVRQEASLPEKERCSVRVATGYCCYSNICYAVCSIFSRLTTKGCRYRGF